MALKLEALAPADAIAALERRGRNLDPTFAWQDVFQEDHAAMFTVAKSAGFDILGDIYSAFEEALKTGQTQRDFDKRLVPLLQEKGWWGKQIVQDPATGEDVVAQLGSLRRLRTIFDANMRVSYASGHWTSFERNKAARPFLRYVHLENQENPRLQHHLWHNTVLPVDHPWWNTHACPNGWFCHCTLQSLSQRDVNRLQRQGERLRFEALPVEWRDWVNKRTGEVTRVPVGIDPGWGYNPGKAGYQAGLAGAEKLIAAPPPIAAAANEDPSWVARPLARECAEWFDQAGAGGRVEQSTVAVGALDDRVLDRLKALGVEPQSGAITVDQRAVQHMLRDSKAEAGRGVPAEILRRMPELLRVPTAILRDRADGSLLYVFDVGTSGSAGKLVVRLDFAAKVREAGAKPVTITTNAVRTAGVVPEAALRNAGAYEILSGAV